MVDSRGSGSGAYVRDSRYITTRITRNGRDGFPVEPGRYRLVVSRACPWATRATIVRRLLGLEDVISLGVCGPTHDERSWQFDLDPGGIDPVLGIERIRSAYLARDPDYSRGITVPAIVDVPTGAVVTNDFAQLTLDLSTQWTGYHGWFTPHYREALGGRPFGHGTPPPTPPVDEMLTAGWTMSDDGPESSIDERRSA